MTKAAPTPRFIAATTKFFRTVDDLIDAGRKKNVKSMRQTLSRALRDIWDKTIASEVENMLAEHPGEGEKLPDNITTYIIEEAKKTF